MNTSIKKLQLWIACFALLFASNLTASQSVLNLLQRPHPVEPVYSSLERSSHLCDAGSSCNNCNIDVKVGTTLFIHGYASHFEGFEYFDQQLAKQNQCAGYDNYRVSIGQDGGLQTNGYVKEIECSANEGDGRCLGHCTRHGADGRCLAYDRSKNGVCGPRSGNSRWGLCVGYSQEGAKKFLDVWAEDLAYFFANNRLLEAPDHSITIMTHSTGAPALVHFMARGFEGDPRFALASRKVKEIINIQAAIGGACGAGTVGTLNDDASRDLQKLSNGTLKYDFRHATYEGNIPWTHVQTFGSSTRECMGSEVKKLGVSTYTGFSCLSYTHDGVTQNWDHNTSVKHPHGAGRTAGEYPYNITVHDPVPGSCHTAQDPSRFPSFRQDLPSFYSVFGRQAVPVDLVKNLTRPQPWWPFVLNPWRDL